MKLLHSKKTDLGRVFFFEYRGIKEEVWFASNQNLVESDNDATPFLFFAAVFAMMENGILDLNNFSISNTAFINLRKISEQYKDWFPELCLTDLRVLNTKKVIPISHKETPSALAFTGGVDSLFSLQKLVVQESALSLFHIEGFDNHYADQNTYTKIYESFQQLEKIYNLSERIIIQTNIRDFTEKFINWEKINGLCLAACVYSLQTPPQRVYFSLNGTRAEENYNCGCQHNLNSLFSSELVEFRNTGTETRMEKIEKLARNHLLLPHLRVCWKNTTHRANCGSCEKCVRTMLGLMAFLKPDHVYKIFNINKLRTEDIRQMKIGNSEKWFYEDIYNKLPESLPEYKNTLKDKLNRKSSLSSCANSIVLFPPQKKKSILFIDFNGVISYKPFWFSIADKSHELNYLHEKIESFLFKENIHIIIDWMNGVCTSEDVHELIYEKLGHGYEKEALWKVFVDDCKKIDISQPIISALQKMKDSYYIILMTDNMDSFDRFTLKAQKDRFKVFDDISNSYNEGQGKRNGDCARFYRFIDKYETNRSHCLLLDDSSGNCNAFEKDIGGKSYQVKTEQEVLDTLQSIKNSHINRWEWQY